MLQTCVKTWIVLPAVMIVTHCDFWPHLSNVRPHPPTHTDHIPRLSLPWFLCSYKQFCHRYLSVSSCQRGRVLQRNAVSQIQTYPVAGKPKIKLKTFLKADKTQSGSLSPSLSLMLWYFSFKIFSFSVDSVWQAPCLFCSELFADYIGWFPAAVRKNIVHCRRAVVSSWPGVVLQWRMFEAVAESVFISGSEMCW